mgnify:CR=1 FL=1
MNINFGGQGGFINEQTFNQIADGNGIDNNEYQNIVNCCKQGFMQNLTPLSTNAGKYIKQSLVGVSEYPYENTRFFG